MNESLSADFRQDFYGHLGVVGFGVSKGKLVFFVHDEETARQIPGNWRGLPVTVEVVGYLDGPTT